MKKTLEKKIKKKILTSKQEIQDNIALIKWIQEKLIFMQETIKKMWKFENIDKKIGAQLGNMEQNVEVMRKRTVGIFNSV